ncbi:protein ANKUB1-like [Halichoeres trimaculatus]|uniref:protein ANKUB1-like n=1 Tax=Halichoeres trimaculatus TaxID=147232 RepID=UPI003D9E15CD
MRIFVCFEGCCERFDVAPDQTVGAMKQMVKENFLVQLSDDKQLRQYLELIYGGAALQDSWALRDVGVRSGSFLQCLIKSEERPVMHVFNAITGEILQIMGSKALLHISVARLKTLVSMQSGLPVSTFRLSTPSGVHLYDCNLLHDYAIEIGSTLRLDTWDGWVEFLQGCLRGNRLTIQNNLSENKPVMRFQLQVALYIAASLGHLDVAGWLLLEKGVHPEEPVGVHPYRQWCQQTAHRDTDKCPIHVAAESSQLLILKFFVARSPSTLVCRDPEGHNPLKVALQRGHKDCVRYLANKLYSVVSLPNMTLPMRIYLQIKRWLGLGQKRVALNQCQYPSAAFIARAGLGDKLLVDGFNQTNMSSKSRRFVTRPNRKPTMQVLQTKTPYRNLFIGSDCTSTRTLSQLPSLQCANFHDVKKNENMWQHDSNTNDELLEEICKQDSSQCRGKFLLPPITKNTSTRPMFVGEAPNYYQLHSTSLEPFSHHCGWTSRENATYCLTTASTFTEKAWQKQLKIARTLMRKRVRTKV